MFTITPAQLARLAAFPDTLGCMILTLSGAQEDAMEDGRLDFQPAAGWSRAEPGAAARARNPGDAMRGYRSDCGSITLTTVQSGDRVGYVAEGAGWMIEADGPYDGWMALSSLDEVEIEDDEVDDDPRDDTQPDGHVPVMLRPDFDWDAQVARQPGHTLSRLHVMAVALDLRWAMPPEGKSPAGSMMDAVEATLGIEPSRWHLPLGRRITVAESRMEDIAGGGATPGA